MCTSQSTILSLWSWIWWCILQRLCWLLLQRDHGSNVARCVIFLAKWGEPSPYFEPAYPSASGSQKRNYVMRIFSLDLKISNPHVVRSGLVNSVLVNLRIGAQQQHHHCYLHFYWIRMLDPSPTSRTILSCSGRPLYFFNVLLCTINLPPSILHHGIFYFCCACTFLYSSHFLLLSLRVSGYCFCKIIVELQYMYIYGPHSSRLIFPQSFGSSQTLSSFILKLK